MNIETLILRGREEESDLLEKARALRTGDAKVVLVEIAPEDASLDAEVLKLLRSFCAEVLLPVYAKGSARKLEDVKKRLYAGCEGVILPPDGTTPEEVIREAEDRFGKDRILSGPPSLEADASIAWEDLTANDRGLVPCIVREEKTGDVLMMAYMNAESFAQTLQTGRMTYWSRSRQALWVKGETSGHVQILRSLEVDCDRDTLLATVRQAGAACHTGNHSCFYTNVLQTGQTASSPEKILRDVYAVIEDRKVNPKEGSYTNYLFTEGLDKILKKFSEEAAETVIAAKNPDREEIVYEMADLLYHMMVLMQEKDLRWEDIAEELANRE